MKFTRIVFTHPIDLPFLGDDGRPFGAFAHSVGAVTTLESPTHPSVDSIEESGHWVVIRFRGQLKAVPAAKVDRGDPVDESASEGQPEPFNASGVNASAEVRRGPGRPRKELTA